MSKQNLLKISPMVCSTPTLQGLCTGCGGLILRQSRPARKHPAGSASEDNSEWKSEIPHNTGILFGRQSDTSSSVRFSCLPPDLSRSILFDFHAENRSMSWAKGRTSLICSMAHPPNFASTRNLKPIKQQRSKASGCTLRSPHESHDDHLERKGGLGNTGTCLGNISPDSRQQKSLS